MITIHSATMSSSDFIHTQTAHPHTHAHPYIYICIYIASTRTALNTDPGDGWTHTKPHLQELTYINTHAQTTKLL